MLCAIKKANEKLLGWNTALNLDFKPLDATFIDGLFYAIDAIGFLYRFEKDGKFKDKRLVESLANAVAVDISAEGDVLAIRENIAISFSLGQKGEYSSKILGLKEITRAAFCGDLFAVIDSEGFLQIFSRRANFYSLAPALFRRPEALFFSPDRRFLFAAERDGSAIVYDLLLHRIALEIKPPKSVIGGAFLPNGRLLLLGRESDMFICSWYANGAAIDSISSPRTSPEALIVTSRYALVGLENGSLTALDLTRNHIARSWRLLNEPIAALKQRGDFIFVIGERGASESYDLSQLKESCAFAIDAEDYDAANALIATSGFTLLNAPFYEWLERAWEESVYPSAVRFMEEGKTDLAKEAILPFWEDLTKRELFEEALPRAAELGELREAFKNRRMRETQTLLNANPILNESLSGRLFFEEWKSAVEEAIERIKSGENDLAKKALEPFENALEKGETARHIIDFPASFIHALELYRTRDWQSFDAWCDKEPICKGLPHFEEKARKIAALEREMNSYADRHFYQAALDTAKELSAFGFNPILKDPIAALFSFLEAAQKGKDDTALALAAKYPFLTDAPQFLSVFKESAAHFERASKAAEIGDSQAVYLLISDEAKSPLFLDYSALLLRIGFCEEMRRVVVSGAVNWGETYKNYERYFGRDPLLQLAFNAQNQIETLKITPANRAIQNYSLIGLPRAVISFYDLAKSERNDSVSTLTNIGWTLILIIVAIIALLVFVMQN
jgi:hypothetical protein